MQIKHNNMRAAYSKYKMHRQINIQRIYGFMPLNNYVTNNCERIENDK